MARERCHTDSLMMTLMFGQCRCPACLKGYSKDGPQWSLWYTDTYADGALCFQPVDSSVGNVLRLPSGLTKGFFEGTKVYEGKNEPDAMMAVETAWRLKQKGDQP